MPANRFPRDINNIITLHFSELAFLKFHIGIAASIMLICAVIYPVSDTAFASKRNQNDILTSDTTGIIVPLYIYPGAAWDELIEIKNNNSAVPIVAVINPNSGPGSVKDPNYVAGIRELKAAGIVVLGYTWTDYGARSSSAVRSEITKYKNWYSVDGIFFDAMSNLRGKLNYYKNLDNFAKSRGLEMTVGNAGTDTKPIFVGSVDNIVIYESPGTPSLSYLGGWHSNHDKVNFSFISYDVNSMDEQFVEGATQRVGYMYITDDDLPNPYDSLPDYLADLVSLLAQASGSP